MADVVDPLGLNAIFERAVVGLCCSTPEFYSRIGQYIEPKSLSCEPAKLAVEAVKGVFAETSRAPSKPLMVIQWLTRRMREGKRTFEEIRAVNKYLNDADDFGLPDIEEAVSELAALLKRRMQKEIVRDASGEYARRGDFTALQKKIELANSLGAIDDSVGTTVGLGSFDEIQKLQNLERLPFGIFEIDKEIGGGFPRGTETLFIAPTKGGKSVSLTQILATSALHKVPCAEISLELPVPMQLARLKANLTGLPIDAIMNGSMPEARKRMEQLINAGLAPIQMKWMPAGTTTPQAVIDWVHRLEDRMKIEFPVLVIDYANLLLAPKSEGSYQAGKYIHRTLFTFAVKENRWVFTAEQPQRKQRGRKIIGTDDVADSMHSTRIADLSMSINPSEDGGDLTWHIAGSRYCATGETLGPFPHDFECARVGPVDREEPWN
jgi:hypothetical protein